VEKTWLSDVIISRQGFSTIDAIPKPPPFLWPESRCLSFKSQHN